MFLKDKKEAKDDEAEEVEPKKKEPPTMPASIALAAK